MAEIKISELTSGSTLDGTEVVPIVQSGATVKVTTQDIADLGGGGGLQGVHAIFPLASGDSITNSINGGTNNFPYSANRISTAPFIPAQNITSQSLYVYCSSALAGALGRILIYDDLNGLPNAKIYESADLDLSTTGLKTTLLTFDFVAGTTYWLAYHSNGFNPTISILSNTNGVAIKTINGVVNNMLYINTNLGTAPATWTPYNYNSFSIPLVGITKA